MMILRSILFQVAFYLSLFVLLVVGLPTLLIGPLHPLTFPRAWGRVSLWLLRVICGMRVEFRGVENIPHGGVIVAPKHQSTWETFALLPFFPDFAFIVKKELTWIPFFGWYLYGARQIAVDRARGKSALSQAARLGGAALAAGRQLFIFPEGTRRPAGAAPLYKFGVAQIYERCESPCLPIALNAGLFWPRRSFIKRPGVVLVEFLPVIPAGLEKSAFMACLQDAIETATDRLMAESIAADPSLARNLVADSSATARMGA